MHGFGTRKSLLYVNIHGYPSYTCLYTEALGHRHVSTPLCRDNFHGHGVEVFQVFYYFLLRAGGMWPLGLWHFSKKTRICSPTISNIGTKILFKACFSHNSTHKAPPELIPELATTTDHFVCAGNVKTRFKALNEWVIDDLRTKKLKRFYSKLVSAITRRTRHLRGYFRS